MNNTIFTQFISKASILMVIVALLGISSQAALDFEGIVTTPGVHFGDVPDQYGFSNLSWGGVSSHFGVADNTVASPTSVSGNWAAFKKNGQGTIEATTGTFSVNSGYFAALDTSPNPLSVTIKGYLGGAQIGSTITFDATTSYASQAINLANIDKLVILSGPTSGKLLIDDLDITTATPAPEPGTMALMGIGATALLMGYRRRSVKA